MSPIADDSLDRFISGRAQAVAWNKIEAELAALWRQAAEADAKRVLVRACLWNLLALAPGGGEAAMNRYRALIDRLSAEVPCRVIGLCERDEHTELGAFVEANWRGHGAVQNGSDEVLLVGASQLRPRLESLARSLLVPDAGVALYVDGRPDSARIPTMLAGVDRLIVDSRLLDAPEQFNTYARLVAAQKTLTIADLAWIGISPLRSTVASLFDRPDAATALRALDRIDVVAGVAGFASRAFLFLGWLSARLGLTVVARRVDGGTWRCTATHASGRPIELTLRGEAARGHGIARVELTAAQQVWRVDRDDAGLHIDAPGTPPRVQPARRHEDADLVIAALGVRGADPVYRGALAAALTLGGPV